MVVSFRSRRLSTEVLSGEKQPSLSTFGHLPVAVRLVSAVVSTLVSEVVSDVVSEMLSGRDDGSPQFGCRWRCPQLRERYMDATGLACVHVEVVDSGS